MSLSLLRPFYYPLIYETASIMLSSVTRWPALRVSTGIVRSFEPCRPIQIGPRSRTRQPNLLLFFLKRYLFCKRQLCPFPSTIALRALLLFFLLPFSVPFLPARRYASAGTSHGPVSACLSVTSQSSIETAERIELFGRGASFDPSYTVFRRNSGIFKNEGTSLWNFVTNSGL